MKRKALLAGVAYVWVAAALASPTLLPNGVAISQGETGRLRIDYELTGAEDAIVTVDVQTNGVTLARSEVRSLSGDVNRRIKPGKRTAYWKARQDIPDVRLQSPDGVKVLVKAWSVVDPPDIMVVDLARKRTVNYYETEAELPEGRLNCDAYKTTKMAFRRIRAGHVEWRMGSPSSEQSRTDNETCHRVTLNDDFYMGVFELTVAQKEIIMGRSSSNMTAHGTDWYGNARGGGYNWPAYKDPSSGSYLGKLRSHVGGGDFDLPLEAQWEFACRAGCPHQFYYTLEDDGTLRERNLADLAVFKDNGSIGSPVGQFLPNAYGLYDMLGSRNEYCRDMWKADNVTNVDPNVGPIDGSGYVIRGGSYHNNWPYCRCAWRVQCTDSTVNTYVPGFRFVCTIGTEP